MVARGFAAGDPTKEGCAYRSEVSRSLLEIFLYFGGQRSVKIFGYVGDPQQVPSTATLFAGPVRHQLGFRLSRFRDNDLFAGGGAVDQLGQVRLRLVQVHSFAHRSASSPSHG